MANRSRESRRRAGRGRSTVRRAHRRDRPRRRRPRRDWPRGRPASPRGSAAQGRRAGGPQARGCRRRARTGAGTAKGNVDRTDQVDARAGNAREGDRGAQRVAALVRAVEGHADGRERQLSLLKSRGCDGDRPGRSVEEALRRAAGRCVRRVRGGSSRGRSSWRPAQWPGRGVRAPATTRGRSSAPHGDRRRPYVSVGGAGPLLRDHNLELVALDVRIPPRAMVYRGQQQLPLDKGRQQPSHCGRCPRRRRGARRSTGPPPQTGAVSHPDSCARQTRSCSSSRAAACRRRRGRARGSARRST